MLSARCIASAQWRMQPVEQRDCHFYIAAVRFDDPEELKGLTSQIAREMAVRHAFFAGFTPWSGEISLVRARIRASPDQRGHRQGCLASSALPLAIPEIFRKKEHHRADSCECRPTLDLASHRTSHLKSANWMLLRITFRACIVAATRDLGLRCVCTRSSATTT
jgi:hypothetical protein